jgi:hypothetical protein
MAIHKVKVQLPLHEIGKADALFIVRSNGKKVGEMTISKGGVQWYSHKARKPLNLTWKQFDQAMEDFQNSR